MSKTPQPKELESATPLLQSTNVIHVLPIAGIDGPLKLVLADAVAATLRDSERPAVLAKDVNNQGPTVIGKVTKIRAHGSVVWITTAWELRAPYGTVVSNRNREIVIDKRLWDTKSVEIVNLIVGDAMPAVADMVQDHVGPLHVAESAGTEPSEPAPAASPIAAEQPVAEAPTPMTPATPAADAIPSLEAENANAEKAAEVKAPMAAPDLPSPAPAAKPPLILAPKSSSPDDAPPQVEGLTADELTTSPQADAVQPPPETASPSLPAAPELPQSRAAAAREPGIQAGIAAAPGDTPVVWGRPSFLLRPVRGAPGDGNEALIAAMRAALRGKDLTVTDDPRQAGYEVVGSVDVGPPVNGRQRARIAWVVNTIAGEEVGKAVQENVIASGSLDAAWGRVATIVTAAAADGIQQLFDAPRPKYTPIGKVPDFPKIPMLPRVPGRALPPPPS